MNRVKSIMLHGGFIKSLAKTDAYEKERIFCGHGMEHLLDVARIAYILSLEDGINADKELIYAAALLHDIGRARQYEDGTPHEQESVRISSQILPECGFNDDETEMILEAILSHRTKSGEKPGFTGLLYRADKLSRRCCECKAEKECDWAIKNTRLEY